LPKTIKLAVAAGIFIFYGQKSLDLSFLNTISEPQKLKQVSAFIKDLPKKDVLLIVNEAPFYTMQGFGAVTYQYASDHEGDIRESFNNGHVARILRVQDGKVNRPLGDSEKLVTEQTYAPGKSFHIVEILKEN
jgi:hypothetical protein